MFAQNFLKCHHLKEPFLLFTIGPIHSSHNFHSLFSTKKHLPKKLNNIHMKAILNCPHFQCLDFFWAFFKA